MRPRWHIVGKIRTYEATYFETVCLLPGGHKPQWYEPYVFIHLTNGSSEQPPLFILHSSMSKHWYPLPV